ncbi:hypothetical protein [Planctomycetes bacterium CA13]
MPASGALGGASIASPQDIQSAINGNPATVRQYRGTQFSFSGAWMEPTYNLTQDGALPLFGVSSFSQTKSDAPGVAAGNIGLTQELSASGLPLTMGMGLISAAGAGADFRQVPESNGTHASLTIIDIVGSAGLELTDNLHVGGTFALSTATMSGPFVGITGSSTGYGIRGGVGVNYAILPQTNIGAYWKSQTSFTFDNLAGFTAGSFVDVAADRPETFGIGISNQSLMDGKLLLAVDGVFQKYSDADLFTALYDDQWSLHVGAQYSPTTRCRWRIGYAFAENPLRSIVPAGAGGVLPPGGVDHITYIQSLFANIPEHRITGGFGISDICPGVDLDLYAGGMFEDSVDLGSTTTTTASLEGYWVGFGLTWRFCRGMCH